MFLVTGGCGFIGSHLVDLLIDKGYSVRVVDDLSNSSKQFINPKAEYIYGSIADKALCQQALKDIKGIFHLAAKVSVPESITHWHTNHTINCGATVRLLELSKTIPIIFASTAAVYGDSPPLPQNENSLLKPLSPYAVDKIASEMHIQIAWALHQTSSIVFRFFNIYGPRQNPSSPYSGVISKFAHSILKKEPITIFGDGKQRRDFVYVGDVVRLLLKCMEEPLEGAHIYNLCTGNTTSIFELADLMGKLTGSSVIKEFAPQRQGEILISQGDPKKLLQERGLKTEISLEEGLELYLHNLKKNL